MGQKQSNTLISLSCYHIEQIQDEHCLQQESFLRKLSDEFDDVHSLMEWEKKTTKGKPSILRQWNSLGFAIQLLNRWGKHHLMLTYSVRQIELALNLKRDLLSKLEQAVLISNDLEVVEIVADSYLNLARSNFLLSEFRKSLNYGEKCLKFIGEIRRGSYHASNLSGYVYLCKGKCNLGLSKFKDAMQDFETTLRIARNESNKALECLTCCSFSSFYLQLKDYEKALFFSMKSLEIIQQHGKNWNRKYRTTVQLCMAEAYRKIGKVTEAMEASEDAMQLAMKDQDRYSQAYCILCFADIHRARKDHKRAMPRYNVAKGLMIEVGDSYGQSLVALGKAKAFLRSKDFSKAMVEYKSALQVAEKIDNKAICMRIHGEMAILYQRLSSPDLARNSSIRYHNLLESMELFCEICRDPIGEKQESLEAFACSHVFHTKCISHQEKLLNAEELQFSCPSCESQITKPFML